MKFLAVEIYRDSEAEKRKTDSQGDSKREKDKIMKQRQTTKKTLQTQSAR